MAPWLMGRTAPSCSLLWTSFVLESPSKPSLISSSTAFVDALGLQVFWHAAVRAFLCSGLWLTLLGFGGLGASGFESFQV